MSGLFDTSSENVLIHLKNVSDAEELIEPATTKDFLVVRTEGKRQVKRSLRHYSLDALTTDQGRGLVDVIARYTHTFLWLQRYDEGLLTEPLGSPGGKLPSTDEARTGIARLKADLMAREEATALFGNEREGGLAAVLGNLDQTVFGEPAYPTVESKAAHLRCLSQMMSVFFMPRDSILETLR